MREMECTKFAFFFLYNSSFVSCDNRKVDTPVNQTTLLSALEVIYTPVKVHIYNRQLSLSDTKKDIRLIWFDKYMSLALFQMINFLKS